VSNIISGIASGIGLGVDSTLLNQSMLAQNRVFRSYPTDEDRMEMIGMKNLGQLQVFKTENGYVLTATVNGKQKSFNAATMQEVIELGVAEMVAARLEPEPAPQVYAQAVGAAQNSMAYAKPASMFQEALERQRALAEEQKAKSLLTKASELWQRI
jgi:hypothetical protein